MSYSVHVVWTLTKLKIEQCSSHPSNQHNSAMPSQWSVHNKAEKVTDSAHNTQSRDDIQSQKAGHLFSQSKKKKDQDKFPVMIFLKKHHTGTSTYKDTTYLPIRDRLHLSCNFKSDNLNLIANSYSNSGYNTM